jgi:hypothetical protein
MAQKEAIMRALMEAMGSSAPMTSKRPMARPKAGMGRAGASLMGEAGKTMSDADRMRQRRMDRAGMLQALEAGEMGQMSPIELERLRKKLGMMGGGKVMKYESGGAVEVKGKKKKPKMGCVMKGRGGKYKGRS